MSVKRATVMILDEDPGLWVFYSSWYRALHWLNSSLDASNKHQPDV